MNQFDRLGQVLTTTIEAVVKAGIRLSRDKVTYLIKQWVSRRVLEDCDGLTRYSENTKVGSTSYGNVTCSLVSVISL